MTNRTNWKKITQDATDFVKKATEIIRANQFTSTHVSYKQDHSLVTSADRQVEKLLTKLIKKNYPTHEIFGEEYGGNLEDEEPIWIIDPIEGTTNYYYGISNFGVQLAILYQAEIVVSVIFEPESNNLITATKNVGVLINNSPPILAPISFSAITLLFDTGRDKRLMKLFFNADILSSFRSFRRFGSLVTDAIFLLNNHYSVYLCFSAKLYDFAPISLVLTEAGYSVFNEAFESWDPQSTCLFACHPQQQSSLIKLLKPIINYRE